MLFNPYWKEELRWRFTCYEPQQNLWRGLRAHETGLTHPVLYYWSFQGFRSTSVVVHYNMSYLMTKPTECLVRPLCTQWVAKDPSYLHADSEDSDQTGRMSRLIWVFGGRTDHFVGFVMRWLNSYQNRTELYKFKASQTTRRWYMRINTFH